MSGRTLRIGRTLLVSALGLWVIVGAACYPLPTGSEGDETEPEPDTMVTPRPTLEEAP